MDSARFATVMFMFRHQGRVRVVLSEQDVTGGGVDRLFENALAAGAEDFDQVPGVDQGVEVEVRPNSLLWIHCHLMIYIFLDGLR
jgi:transcriptional/translational regulatory protein YebC/TACO1